MGGANCEYEIADGVACRVQAIGRCENCSIAFCASHRAALTDHLGRPIGVVVDECVGCNVPYYVVSQQKSTAAENSRHAARTRFHSRLEGIDDPVLRYLASVKWSGTIGRTGMLSVRRELMPVVQDVGTALDPSLSLPIGSDPLAGEALVQAWFISTAVERGLHPDTVHAFWVPKRSFRGRPKNEPSGVPIMRLTEEKPAWTLKGASSSRYNDTTFYDYFVPADGVGGPRSLAEGMTIVGIYRMAELLGL